MESVNIRDFNPVAFNRMFKKFEYFPMSGNCVEKEEDSPLKVRGKVVWFGEINGLPTALTNVGQLVVWSWQEGADILSPKQVKLLGWCVAPQKIEGTIGNNDEQLWCRNEEGVPMVAIGNDEWENIIPMKDLVYLDLSVVFSPRRWRKKIGLWSDDGTVPSFFNGVWKCQKAVPYMHHNKMFNDKGIYECNVVEDEDEVEHFFTEEVFKQHFQGKKGFKIEVHPYFNLFKVISPSGQVLNSVE